MTVESAANLITKSSAVSVTGPISGNPSVAGSGFLSILMGSTAASDLPPVTDQAPLMSAPIAPTPAPNQAVSAATNLVTSQTASPSTPTSALSPGPAPAPANDDRTTPSVAAAGQSAQAANTTTAAQAANTITAAQAANTTTAAQAANTTTAAQAANTTTAVQAANTTTAAQAANTTTAVQAAHTTTAAQAANTATAAQAANAATAAQAANTATAAQAANTTTAAATASTAAPPRTAPVPAAVTSAVTLPQADRSPAPEPNAVTDPVGPSATAEKSAGNSTATAAAPAGQSAPNPPLSDAADHTQTTGTISSLSAPASGLPESGLPPSPANSRTAAGINSKAPAKAQSQDQGPTTSASAAMPAIDPNGAAAVAAAAGNPPPTQASVPATPNAATVAQSGATPASAGIDPTPSSVTLPAAAQPVDPILPSLMSGKSGAKSVDPAASDPTGRGLNILQGGQPQGPAATANSGSAPAQPSAPNAGAPSSNGLADGISAQAATLSQLANGPGTVQIRASQFGNLASSKNNVAAAPSSATGGSTSVGGSAGNSAVSTPSAVSGASDQSGTNGDPTGGKGTNFASAGPHGSAAASTASLAASNSSSDQIASNLPAGSLQGPQTSNALGPVGDPAFGQQVPVTAQGVAQTSQGAEQPPGMDQQALAIEAVTGGNAAANTALAGDGSLAAAASVQSVIQPDGPSAPTGAAAASLPQAASATPAEQIKVQLAKGMKDGSDSITILLHPEDLGTVEVKLQMQDGAVKANISADNPATLALLKNDAHQLQQSLQNAGFNTDANGLSFQLRDPQQQNSAFAQQQQNNGQNGQNNTTGSGSTGDLLIEEMLPGSINSLGNANGGLDISV